ncbi:hypothetical protein Poly21_52700 [Allorhodopirellula heiligendammensis]|uniref:Uncharacterized protein n=1 Tax=Allorhodopirellula heiligendammensis TaxID=2714739 RepID=A0A5C6BDY2_9BACT|nr:hypothetical protein Poly21_52700 [Allorhodopirellula heiligendammensis]
MVDHERIANIGSKIRELELRKGDKRLFHCCHDDHGDKLVVREQPPKGFEKNNESYEPRLCVARSIPQCFAAMCKGRKDTVFVYEVDQPALATTCSGTTDAPLTSEYWLPPGATLAKVATIEADRVTEIHRRTWQLLESFLKPSGIHSRVASIVAACEVLDDQLVTTSLELLLRAEIGLEVPPENTRS